MQYDAHPSLFSVYMFPQSNTVDFDMMNGAPKQEKIVLRLYIKQYDTHPSLFSVSMFPQNTRYRHNEWRLHNIIMYFVLRIIYENSMAHAHQESKTFPLDLGRLVM